jgi:hypothetical protein
MIDSEMPTTREVLDTTIALERQSMELYARLGKLYAREPEIRDFWLGMARDEARHVGALELVSTILGLDDKLDQPSPVSLEDSTIVRLRDLLERHRRDIRPGLPIADALRIAVELEETELEDLVADLLKAVQATDEHRRSLRLLVHDLGELSYMIERNCQDPELLQRCDALVERHAEALRHYAGERARRVD